ncbi:MAG: hypothetical protein KY475_10365 [Planctomycetes bacterium]|nr:hypothetical protein [Planctomycetota bacterium]
MLKIAKTAYNALDKHEYSNFGPGSQYFTDVNSFRSPQPVAPYNSGRLGYDLVIGPEAHQPAGTWVMNPAGQIQYKWETMNAVGHLKAAYLIPVIAGVNDQ